MLHLEDFLELIENLPCELRDRFTEIRTLDLEVQNGLDVAEKHVAEHFKKAINLTHETQEDGFDEIKYEYQKILECADEKVNIATMMHDLVKRYLSRLDQEVAKFKIELEADNPGITETLEQKVKETDQITKTPKRDRIKKRKRNSPLLNGNHNAVFHSENFPNGPTHIDSHGRHVSIAPSIVSGYSPAMGKNSTFKKCQSVPNKLADVVKAGGTSGQFGSRDRSANFPSVSGISGNTNAPFLQSFTGHAESRHGRQRKLTSRVSEMLRDVIQKQEQRERLGSDAAASTSGAVFNTPNCSGTSTPGGGTASGASFNFERRNSACSDAEGAGNTNQDADGDLSDQSDQQRWCICNRVSYGAMVACDDKDCPFEWFHYECVGITQPPKGKWFCPHCTKRRK